MCQCHITWQCILSSVLTFTRSWEFCNSKRRASMEALETTEAAEARELASASCACSSAICCSASSIPKFGLFCTARFHHVAGDLTIVTNTAL